jgi:hypothetical protein
MTDRKLDTTNMEEAAAASSDLKIFGDPGAWVCIGKASSELGGWMKSTKRMLVPGGWLYQVTTEHRVDGKVVTCAEALAFVPDPAC